MAKIKKKRTSSKALQIQRKELEVKKESEKKLQAKAKRATTKQTKKQTYDAPPKKRKYDASRRVGVKRGPYVKSAYEKYKKLAEKIPQQRRKIIDLETFKQEFREQLAIPTAAGKNLSVAEAIRAIAGAYSYSDKQKSAIVDNLSDYIELGQSQVYQYLRQYIEDYKRNYGKEPTQTHKFLMIREMIMQVASDFIKDLLFNILRNVNTVDEFFNYKFNKADINANDAFYNGFLEVIDNYDEWDNMFDT